MKPYNEQSPAERAEAWGKASAGSGIALERLITPKAKRSKPYAGFGAGLAPDVRTPRPDADALLRFFKANPDTAVKRLEDIIAKGDLSLRQVSGSLPGIFKMLRGVMVKAEMDAGLGERAAVDTAAFPLLMGSLTVAAFNDAYDAVPSIGEQLVTREIESPKKFTHVAKMVGHVGKNFGVIEGEEFPMITAGEEFSVIGSNRKGFQMALSMETLEESGGAPFLNLVDQGGAFAAELVEEQTLSRVCDQNGSASTPAAPYVWYRNGAATQLYRDSTVAQATAQTPSGTRVLNNALASTVNLDAVRTVLAAMLNTRGKRLAIPMSECTLLVPDALMATALKLLGSELEPGVANELNNWGTRGRYRPMLASTPKLDDISTTAFYLGAIQKQFWRKVKIRMETVSVSNDPMAYLKTREAYRARIAWDFEIGAVDNIYVVQSLSGTVAATAPSAAS